MKNPASRGWQFSLRSAVCLVVFLPWAAAADTIIPGGQSRPTRPGRSPGRHYILQNDLNIQGTDGPDGVTTLTIEPGAVVRVGDYRAIHVGYGAPGALVADGDAAGGPATILFTTSNPSPARGLWYGIRFQVQAHPSSVLRNVVVEYAGNTWAGNCGAVEVNTEASVVVLMERLTVRESGYAGLWAYRGTLDVRDSVFTGTNSYNVFIGGSYDPHLSGTITGSTLESVYYAADWPRIAWTGNTFENWGAVTSWIAANDIGVFSTENTFHGVPGAYVRVVGRELSTDATWGTGAGPYVTLGDGDFVVQGTDGDDNVTTLTLLPGVEWRIGSWFRQLLIGNAAPGALVADGDAAGGPAPIRFTSVAASPAPGDWCGIRFTRKAHPSSILRNVIVEYAGTTGTIQGNQAAIEFNTEPSVAIRLERVTIPNSAYWGIAVYQATLDIRGVSIANTVSYSMYIYPSYGTTVAGTVADSSLESIWYANDTPRIAWTGNTFENWGAVTSWIAANDIGVLSRENTFRGVPGAHVRVVGRELSTDATWGTGAGPFVTLGESDFVVQGADGDDNVTTLTLLPGVEWRFGSEFRQLMIGNAATGALVADGDAAGGPAPIRFTSAAASPAPGDWFGLRFTRKAHPGSILRNVIVEYAGTTGTNQGNQAAIEFNTEPSVAIRLERVTIPNSAYWGIAVYQATLDIRGVSIANTVSYSMYIYPSYGTMLAGTVADSSLESIWYANDTPRITWTGNTFENWGARRSVVALEDIGALSTGNTFHKVNGAATSLTGLRISKDATWSPAPGAYVTSVASGAIDVRGTDGGDGVTTLTLLPGVEFRFRYPCQLFRIGNGEPGALVADGSAGANPAPIVFTTDGPTVGRGSWGTLLFDQMARPSLLRNVVVEYGGSTGCANGVLEVNTDPAVTTTVERAIVRDNQGVGLYLASGTVVFRDSTVTGTTTALRLAGAGATSVLEDLSLNADTYAVYAVNTTATINHSDLLGGSWGVYNQTPSYQVDARNNWWGNPSGPSAEGPGTGRQVSAGVLFNPWLGHSDLLNIVGSQGGNSGLVTVEITGGDLDPGASVVLALAGQPDIVAVSVVGDPCRCRLVAVFDLTGKLPGVYDLVIRNPDGSEKRKLASFRVVEGGGEPSLRVLIELPQHVRPLRNYMLRLGYRNEGTQDMPAQLLTVTSPENALMRLNPSDPFAPGPLQVIALGHDESAGVLPPGQTFWIPIQIRTPDLPPHTMVNFEVGRLTADATPIDWDAWEQQVKPPGINAEGWAAVWGNVRSRIGETYADYLAALTQDAAYLVTHGGKTSRVGDLWTFEMLGAADKMIPNSVLAYSRDAFAPARGPALGFTRFALADIVERLRLGPFGRGWSHEWEVSLARPDASTIVVTMPGGLQRTFVNHRGGWESPAGDGGKLVETAAGFELRDAGGSVRRFDAGGNFTRIEDAQGNRLTLTYDAGRLARIERWDGQHLDLAWSGERIVRLQDDAGRVVEYGYDGSWEHLVSVTMSGGRQTRYTYVSAPGTPSDHALGSIQNPGGAFRYFQYDTEGKLAAQWRDGGSERERFTHPSTGELQLTDAVDAVTMVHLGHAAMPLEVVDPLGGRTLYRYDDRLKLRERTGPLGAVWTFAYDAAGNLSETRDPAGSVIRRGYTPDFGRLGWLSDPNSHVIDYQYDAQGNLSGVARVDATTESFSHGPTGDLLTQTNRRGGDDLLRLRCPGPSHPHDVSRRANRRQRVRRARASRQGRGQHLRRDPHGIRRA